MQAPKRDLHVNDVFDEVKPVEKVEGMEIEGKRSTDAKEAFLKGAEKSSVMMLVY